MDTGGEELAGTAPQSPADSPGTSGVQQSADMSGDRPAGSDVDPVGTSNESGGGPGDESQGNSTSSESVEDSTEQPGGSGPVRPDEEVGGTEPVAERKSETVETNSADNNSVDTGGASKSVVEDEDLSIEDAPPSKTRRRLEESRAKLREELAKTRTKPKPKPAPVVKTGPGIDRPHTPESAGLSMHEERLKSNAPRMVLTLVDKHNFTNPICGMSFVESRAILQIDPNDRRIASIKANYNLEVKTAEQAICDLEEKCRQSIEPHEEELIALTAAGVKIPDLQIDEVNINATHPFLNNDGSWKGIPPEFIPSETNEVEAATHG